MPPRGRSSEAGQAADVASAAGDEARSRPAAAAANAEKPRRLPRPNLETASRYACLAHHHAIRISRNLLAQRCMRSQARHVHMGRLRCRLKGFVGNAIDTATSVPAWLASKAVPVAADGAGLFKHAAADAADRVALFRRGCVPLPDPATPPPVLCRASAVAHAAALIFWQALIVLLRIPCAPHEPVPTI